MITMTAPLPPSAVAAGQVSPQVTGLAMPAPPRPARTADLILAWPRCAQHAAMFVLGVLATLLGVQLVSHLRAGEPADLLDPQPVTYRVDLNVASRAELLQLPGVGPNLADRIEDYRRSHSGFKTVDDLRKVSGIGPATMEKLRPLVCVRSDYQATPEADPRPQQSSASSKSKTANIKKPVNVNTASLEELQTLPGIGPKMSQRIVDERDRKPFASVDDLRRVAGIGVKTLDKLRPYVTTGDGGK
jgi:competence protein ComEA